MISVWGTLRTLRTRVSKRAAVSDPLAFAGLSISAILTWHLIFWEYICPWEANSRWFPAARNGFLVFHRVTHYNHPATVLDYRSNNYRAAITANVHSLPDNDCISHISILRVS